MSDLDAIKVTVEDEGLHTPGPDDLWSESFYMDAVSTDRTMGVYVRIGRTVNQDCCIYTAAICEKGKPAIMVVDQKAPLPPANDTIQKIKTANIEVEFNLEKPLERMRVTNSGLAASHEDHSEPLQGGAGVPVQVKFDLVWETDGIPFHWRGTTRYEMPCFVAGTIQIGDRKLNFEGPGQRDHSWANRDWWTPSWTWTAWRLEDGTRLHGVTITTTKGGFPGEGYIQKDGKLVEITDITSEWTKGDNGLPTTARITMEPGGIDMTVTPVAFGALLLTREDGRKADFPRAWATIKLTDGRTGTGWCEWNWPRGL